MHERTAGEVAAFEVARYLREHGGYGGSVVHARRALRRRCPQDSHAKLDTLLEDCERLLDAAKELARKKEARLFAGWDSKRKTLDLDGLDEELAAEFPSLQRHTCTLALQWVFWHHLR